MMYRNFFKPVGDIFLAFILLLLLSPIFILTVILLYFFNQKNVFFFQERPGKDEKIFKIIKFKTMTDERDSEGNLLSDEHRLTKVGSIIRKSSIDELPQLLNVIKGEMSFIGPRPLLVSYLSLYSSEQKRRHLIKPGITGWAQVNGRNTISWKQKFAFDLYYVDNISFFLDFKIFLLTIKKVIIREGINTEGQASGENFRGDN